MNVAPVVLGKPKHFLIIKASDFIENEWKIVISQKERKEGRLGETKQGRKKITKSIVFPASENTCKNLDMYQSRSLYMRN